MRCSFSLKKSRKLWRMSLDVIRRRTIKAPHGPDNLVSRKQTVCSGFVSTVQPDTAFSNYQPEVSTEIKQARGKVGSRTG